MLTCEQEKALETGQQQKGRTQEGRVLEHRTGREFSFGLPLPFVRKVVGVNGFYNQGGV